MSLYNLLGFESLRPSHHWLSLSALIRIKALTSYVSASGIGIGAGLAAYTLHALGVLPNVAIFLPTSSELTNLNDSIVATCLVVFALALSLTVNRFGLRRCWRWLLVSIVAVCGFGLAGFMYSTSTCCRSRYSLADFWRYCSHRSIVSGLSTAS